jgi:hypothetical protein
MLGRRLIPGSVSTDEADCERPEFDTGTESVSDEATERGLEASDECSEPEFRGDAGV